MLGGAFFKKVTHIAFIIVLGGLVYANSINVPFHFDDTPNIVENPIVKNALYFTDTESAAGFERYDALCSRYVGFLTFFLNYCADGLNTTGYHLVNIIIHIINALLVYALVMLSFQTPLLRESRLSEKRHWVALLAASLFVVHPANTQAVTYIVQRLASLAALFYLGSMVSYIKSRLTEGKSKWFYYALALLLAVLAVKTKENAFTLPFAIALYEFMFFRGEPKNKRAVLLVPVLLTMLIIPITLIDLGKPAAQVMIDISSKTEVRDISRGTYLLTEFRVLATYLRLLVLPINQSLDYDYPLYTSETPGQALGGLALMAILIGLATWLYRRREPAAKLASFGIVFFFLALSVESTLVPLLPIFEHRLYLPGVGMLLGASVGAVYLHDMLTVRKARAMAVLLAVVIIALSVQTVQRNSIWQSTVTFWQDVVSKTPHKARGFNNLASAYYVEKNSPDRAVFYYRWALKLDPTYALAHFNLGTIFLSRGEIARAYQHLTKAVALDGELASAHVNLAVLLDEMGKPDAAVAHYTTALRLKPFSKTMHNDFGRMLYQMGRVASAVAQYKQALAIDPAFAWAHNNLGVALNRLGLTAQAIQHYREAIRINGRFAEAHNNLGMTLMEEDRLEDAVMQFQTAIGTKPEHAGFHANLGRAYHLLGRSDQARDELRAALAIDPQNPEARSLSRELTEL